MPARRPPLGARSLVMPQGRRIPRSPAPAAARPAPPEAASETDPLVRKAAGELTGLWSRIDSCDACGRPGAQRVYGTGHPRAPVMLVKERPSPEDLESTNAFSADADALMKAFEALGVPMSWLYGTTAVRCAPAPSESDEIRVCAQHLLEEIETISPRVIVAFGGRAAEALVVLDGRCGLRVPDELSQGTPVPIRSDLAILVTEPLPEGLTQKDAKRRLWRDLRTLPVLLGNA